MVLAGGRRGPRASSSSSRGTQVVDHSRGPEWATWFVGGKLNIAWNCVHRWAASGRTRPRPSSAARTARGASSRSPSSRDEVTRLAEALVAARRRAGRPRRDLPADVAGGGDRLARVRAHRRRPGADLLRLRGARGRAAAPGLRGEGRDHRRERRCGAAARCRCSRSSRRRAREAPSLEHVVVAPWDELRRRLPGDARAARRSTPSIRTCSRTRPARPASRRASLHVQGGFLVSIAREVGYQADARPGDVIHFATDMGWIMGPWTVVGGGAIGATIVFAEGAPDWPPDRLWRLVEEERVTILGCSPTLDPRADPARRPAADLSSLRVVRHDGRAVEPGPVPLALRAGRRRPLPDHQLLGRHRGRRLLPLADARDADQGVLASAARRSGWRWTSSTTTGSRSSARARSASSSAASPFPGMTRGLLARPRALPRDVLAALSRASGRTATGRRSTRTATGSCTAAPTTR